VSRLGWCHTAHAKDSEAKLSRADKANANKLASKGSISSSAVLPQLSRIQICPCSEGNLKQVHDRSKEQGLTYRASSRGPGHTCCWHTIQLTGMS